MKLITAQLDIKAIRPILKPWSAPRLASVRELREAERNLATFVEPVVQARKDAEKNDDNWQMPDDMLGWLMGRQSEFGSRTTHQLAQVLLGLIFASIHTTTMTATNM